MDGIKDRGKWLSLHLYYNNTQLNKLVIHGVEPLLHILSTGQLVDKYFFIRYWDKGSHLRLRLKFRDEDYELGKKLSIAYFQNYLKKYPSKKSKIRNPGTLENNSLHLVEYEREIQRYGGEEAMLVAEDQFQLSTNVVLSILRSSKRLTYDTVIGKAIQLQVLFVLSAGMTPRQASDFFEISFSNYVNFLQQEFGDLEKVFVSFKESFQNSADAISSFIKEAWSMQGSNEYDDYSWEWATEVKEIISKIERIQIDKKLKSFLPETLLFGDVSRNTLEKWAIFESYIHMTNNRLGILNRDEAYIAFLLKESFKKIEL